MDAMYEKLADAIEKSNKAYDIPRIRAAYELAKRRTKDRCVLPVTHTFPIP